MTSTRALLDVSRLAERLSDRFGVGLAGEAIYDRSGQRVRFRPRDLPATQGFSVDLLIGWRSVDAEFVPGSFARALLNEMGRSTPQQRTVFGVFVRGAVEEGATIRFRINDHDADVIDTKTWPRDWNSVELSLHKGPFVIDRDNSEELRSLALTWSARLLGAALALMPLEPVEATASGQVEGGAKDVLVRRYERSAINRAACIEVHGARCLVCGFDFEAFYGPIGAGFIEVHHREMVSTLAPGTVVNPDTDLVPVCSNCHAMVHRRRPPYTVDELKVLVQAAGRR